MTWGCRKTWLSRPHCSWTHAGADHGDGAVDLARRCHRPAESICDCPVPPLATVGDVPLYALDEHTRLGREAIWRLACENDGVRTCLERFVPANRRRHAANVAAFYADAALVARRLMWDQSGAWRSSASSVTC